MCAGNSFHFAVHYGERYLPAVLHNLFMDSFVRQMDTGISIITDIK